MALGEWLNRNPMVGTGIAVIALVIAGFIVYRSVGGGESANLIEQRYFYDMQSGELVVMDNEPAPVTTESGSEAVWATVYTCGSCDNEADRIVTRLEKYSDEVKREVQKPVREQDYDMVQAGTMYAVPPKNPGGEVQWVSAESPQGMQLSQIEMQISCPNGMPQPCSP